MSLAPWRDLAQSHLGEHEIAGSADNQFIVDCFKFTSYWSTIKSMLRNRDEVPWCAAFVSRMLEESGFKSAHSAAAIDYRNYGTPCALQVGCVIVVEHPNGKHHVTFCNEVISNSPGNVIVDCIGGNQSDSVRVSRYNFSGGGTDKILATRWPVK